MKNVEIIYDLYLSDPLKKTIGGIQTYISDLCALLCEMGAYVRIIQFADHDFQCELAGGVQVFGFKIENSKRIKRYQQLYEHAVRIRDNKQYLTIFATDTLIPKKVSGSCIAIQHGIFWDIPRDVNRSLIRQIASKSIEAYRTVSRLKKVDTVVCVDYNFQNWYRTQLQHITAKTIVIPNYTHVAPEYKKPTESINIIFARRLFAYRGTRIFTEAIKLLLKERANIHVTIAGTGEDEQWMREQLDGYDSVKFITYESKDSLAIHADKHIAVVPTVGSEGTSLSLLEAMSAQCAVICTDVGGMTNIVLDGYNGLITRAGDSEQLYDAMKKLIEDPNLRNRLAEKAYETVKEAFSYDRWKQKWTEVIKEL